MTPRQAPGGARRSWSALRRRSFDRPRNRQRTGQEAAVGGIDTQPDESGAGVDRSVRQRRDAVVLVVDVRPGRGGPVPSLSLDARARRGGAARSDELGTVRVL